jgi:D-alanyl-D-alanine carboxypeptidase
MENEVKSFVRTTSQMLASLLLVHAGYPRSADATENAPESSRLLQSCLKAQVDRESFSGTISITQQGQAAVTVHNGVLAGETSAPISDSTRFNLGSTSKMFTAVAIGQLVDAGKIQFDDPVGKYVSGLTSEASAVTLRQLLTHSSGMGDFFRPQNMQAMLKARTASDILPLIASEKPSFVPGAQFAYSNSGFALLGIVVERVSGQTYGDYLREHVFRPAGMPNTGLDPAPLSTLAVGMTSRAMNSLAPNSTGPGSPTPNNGGSQRILAGPSKPAGAENGLILIRPDGKRQPAGDPAAPATLRPAPGATEGYGSPAGGMFSTAIDLQHFSTALSSNALTTAATTKALTSVQIVAAPAANDKPERTYGFGFGVGTESGQKWFGHNGGTLGANVEFAVFPEVQLTIAVLSNRDPPAATNMFRYARELALHPAQLSTCDAAEHTTTHPAPAPAR